MHKGCTRCDKQELALPVLGLYSLVLKQRDQPHMAEVCQMIEQDKERFFPGHIDFVSVDGEGTEHREQRPLLDELVGVMELYVSGGAVAGGDVEARPTQADEGKVVKKVRNGKKTRVYAIDDEEQAVGDALPLAERN